jgi:hypothetical protein
MRHTMRALLLLFGGLATVQACSGSKQENGTGISCVADGVCQPQCAADPDCAGAAMGGSSGSGTVGSGGAGSAPPSSCSGAVRYENNGDDTVTDCQTKLVWEWDVQREGTAVERDWGVYPRQQALDYCAGLTLAGKSDWYLATAQELTTIWTGPGGGGGTESSQICKWNPVFDLPSWQSGFPMCGSYWTSTAGSSQYPAVIFDFHNTGGGASAAYDSGVALKRCVRGGSGPGTGSPTGTGGSGGTNLCSSPYRCNPAQKTYNFGSGVTDKFAYLLEKCDPATGTFSTAQDCSALTGDGRGCRCDAVTTGTAPKYAECVGLDGKVCNGINYTW